MRTPEEAAKELIEQNFSVKQYEGIQAHRKARLGKFRAYRIQAPIETELKLIEYGEKVLKLLKEHYGLLGEKRLNS